MLWSVDYREWFPTGTESGCGHLPAAATPSSFHADVKGTLHRYQDLSFRVPKFSTTYSEWVVTVMPYIFGK